MAVAWLMHAGWDIAHHLWGNPIWPFIADVIGRLPDFRWILCGDTSERSVLVSSRASKLTPVDEPPECSHHNWTMNQTSVETMWALRGFSCALWTDPAGFEVARAIAKSGTWFCWGHAI